jgi:hypothetical protein
MVFADGRHTDACDPFGVELGWFDSGTGGIGPAGLDLIFTRIFFDSGRELLRPLFAI